ncbi:ABC transporter permease [Fuscovulum ytuae]|uniref:ABC transporter permease n=1 Tax=Fuscovulum ytuae TaxID=3042299 RepID=A0ABY8Q974_9RHOB|nr:ABC transporter permease [Fuscovulum sp. YMD61]WGV16812.1 ABC transporter permease [Fuscovulum sp. YMD61]
MKDKALPVLAVLGIILVIWYLGTVWMNSAWVYDQAGREGRVVGFGELVTATMALDRPMLPAPHQVAVALWDGITGQAVTSKRSLVYHGWVTLEATLSGFLMGILLGVSLAIGIVYFRVLEMTVMPWAVISQTIPIVALAPMIVVLSNTLSLGEMLGLENRLVSKTIISAYLSFFPVLVGMVKGLRSPDAMQLDQLATWNASGWQSFRYLRLPASMPYFFASLKVAIAAALVGAIVGELPTGAVEGLGARMLVASQFGQPLLMWASLFAAALVAGLLILAVGAVQRAADRAMGVRP